MGTLADYIGCKCSKVKNDEKSDKLDQILKDSLAERSLPESVIKIETKEFVRQVDGDVFSMYEKKDLLGEGAFGAVYSVRLKGVTDTEIIRALKIIDKSKINGSDSENDTIKNEINVLKKIDHPNIMKIYEFYEDKENFYIIAEFCDSGDVGKIMDDYGNFPEFLVKYIMYQVFQGVTYLHNLRIVHSDIKRENIAFVKISNEKYKNNSNVFEKIIKNKEIRQELNECPGHENLSNEAMEIVDELSNYEVKIVDFGSAKVKKKKKKLHGITGTAYYCSPEVIHEEYSSPCDVWACGVMMFLLLAGRPPFLGSTEEELFQNILKDKLDLNIEELKDVSESCKDLISKMLDKDDKKRIKARDALKHKFFNEGINIGNLLKGKWKDNKDLLMKYATGKIKSLGSIKKENFKEAVIAYIVFKFMDKNEEKEIKKVFRELCDENQRYLITKETFVNYMKKYCKNFSEEEIIKLYDELDQNGSGNIEYEELSRALCNKEKLLCEKNLKNAFKFFDRDNSGKISLDEVADVVYQGKEMPEDVVKDFLEEFGKNENDTTIDYNEFVKIIRE